MKIAISSGHSTKCQGAVGYLNEVAEATRVVDRVYEIWQQRGVECWKFHDTTSTDSSTNLHKITDWHNSRPPHELDISVHFNAGGGTGTEVLYLTQQELADEVSAAIAEAADWTDRGPKYRSDLFVLNQCAAPTILIEVCFVDSASDADQYRMRFENICQAICGSITGEAEQPPVAERPERPEKPTDILLNDRPTISRGDIGEDVEDMQRLIPGFSGEIDGDFGPITEEELTGYQLSRGLTIDGICGQQTWQALYDRKPPLPPPPHALSEHQIEIICNIANESAISAYAWEDRGVAPRGYMQGMALAFAQTYLKLRLGHPAAVEMSKKRASSDKDALHVYRAEFDTLDMSNETAGVDVLRHLYALMLGHGMRESSGRHCEGRDLSADNVSSDTAECGLFQTSYNAHSASDPEFSSLMAEYSNPANKATCYLSVFDDEVNCTSEEWGCYGAGVGYDFQKLCKECPPFAVETCALTLRNLCNHYGPILRKESELKNDSDAMFRAVQDYIDSSERIA